MENIVDRAYQRVNIKKGLSYNGLDSNLNVIDRYMGVGIDISQGGIQLETARKINTEHILLMFFDYQSNYIATKGQVVYSIMAESGKFRTGIKFLGNMDEIHRFVKKLLKSYHYQKKVPIFVS